MRYMWMPDGQIWRHIVLLWTESIGELATVIIVGILLQKHCYHTISNRRMYGSGQEALRSVRKLPTNQTNKTKQTLNNYVHHTGNLLYPPQQDVAMQNAIQYLKWIKTVRKRRWVQIYRSSNDSSAYKFIRRRVHEQCHIAFGQVVSPWNKHALSLLDAHRDKK